jgi:hypothetical protein
MKKVLSVHFLYALIIVCAVLGCKKNNNVQPTTPFIYGTLHAWMAGKSVDSGGAGYNEWADATFWADSLSQAVINIGNITLNGFDTALQFPYSQYVPLDYKFENGVQWDIPAYGKWEAFSFSTQGSFPCYNGNIPDTIDALNGVSFNVSNAITNNADSVKITIGYYGYSVYVTCGGNQIATFTPESFEFLSNNNSGNYYQTYSISVQASKYDYKIVNGKKFQFVRTYLKIVQAYIR